MTEDAARPLMRLPDVSVWMEDAPVDRAPRGCGARSRRGARLLLALGAIGLAAAGVLLVVAAIDAPPAFPETTDARTAPRS